MENKYTVRDFLSAIIANENVAEQEKGFARAMLEKMDERNEKRKNTPSKEQVANESTKTLILEALADGAKVASELGTALEMSTQKVSALCRQLVTDGKLIVSDRKVPKKGVVKQYNLVR